MTERKAPREFWIRDNAKHYGAKNNKYSCFDTKVGVSNIDYHVREVLPDEPDWKSMAEELAEALKFYAERNNWRSPHYDSETKHIQKLEARIAKLRTGLCRLRNEAESYRVECDDGYAYLIDVAESVLTEDDKESAGSDE